MRTLFIILIVLNITFSILSIGKCREPTTPGEALVGLILNGYLIYLLTTIPGE